MYLELKHLGVESLGQLCSAQRFHRRAGERNLLPLHTSVLVLSVDFSCSSECETISLLVLVFHFL